MNIILAIETSCDETAAAILRDGINILGSTVHSQVLDHHKYGGVVPEIASRKHIEYIIPVIRAALQNASLTLEEIDAIAVTTRPGLIGSLLIGLSAAKSIAFALDVPIIPIDHLEGHIYATILTNPGIKFPFVCLVVSGGHTDLYYITGHGQYELLGQTRDDAAGEAFDKVAKVLGLGYPGGPVIDRMSIKGNPNAIDFPRAYLEKGSLDFSFSGLKTSVFNYIKFQDKGIPIQQEDRDMRLSDIAASFQEAVVDVLIAKSMAAVEKTCVKNLSIGGGVAANSRLRERMKAVCEDQGIALTIPPMQFCVDNACMIGCAAFFNQERATRDWALNAHSDRDIDLY